MVFPSCVFQDLEDTKVEEKVRHVSVKEIRTTEQIKKLETFIDRVKDSSVREGPITLLDLTSNQMQLLLTLVYKRDSVRTGDGPIHLCQLYIGDILIAEGEGKHKRMAQVDVYNRAYEVLISTPVETIISENHRLEPGELEDPDVLDVVVKGKNKITDCSNHERKGSQCIQQGSIVLLPVVLLIFKNAM